MNRLACATLAAFALALTAAQKDSAPSLSFIPSGPDRPNATFEVRGLGVDTLRTLADHPDQWSEILTVFTVDDPRNDARAPGARPTLLGRYELDQNAGALRFHSRFPSAPGVHYRVVFRPAGTRAEPLVATYSVRPAPTRSTTRVTRVSPTAGVLPENLLKFYIEFSSPMSRGAAYEHLHLLDSDGRPLDLPFLELGEELWDHRGQRFTLLFDPGRIKRGLKPREEMGPVLVAGRSYTLVIDRAWCDAEGNPLVADVRKPFRAGPADESPPDLKRWRIVPPAAGTREPLIVEFPEPLDRALLGRMLGVFERAAVPGQGEVGADETSWRFTPEAPWHRGAYTLHVGQAIEDRAGNSVGRLFEIDVFGATAATPAAEETLLPFEVTPKAPAAAARPPQPR